MHRSAPHEQVNQVAVDQKGPTGHAAAVAEVDWRCRSRLAGRARTTRMGGKSAGAGANTGLGPRLASTISVHRILSEIPVLVKKLLSCVGLFVFGRVSTVAPPSAYTFTNWRPSAQLRRTTYTVSAVVSGAKNLACASAFRLGAGAVVQAITRPLSVRWQYGDSAVGSGAIGVAQPASSPTTRATEAPISLLEVMAFTSKRSARWLACPRRSRPPRPWSRARP